MKKFGVSLLYTFAFILGLTLIITLLNYVNIINFKVLTIFKLLIPLISIFIGSFMLGRKISKKGYLEGIKFGIIISLIFLIISLIFKIGISWSTPLYYLILISTSVLGSIIGINSKKKST